MMRAAFLFIRPSQLPALAQSYRPEKDKASQPNQQEPGYGKKEAHRSSIVADKNRTGTELRKIHLRVAYWTSCFLAADSLLSF